MTGRSPLPDTDMRRIRRFVEDRVPAHVRDRVRLELEVQGSAVTIVERRAPWTARMGPAWTRSAIASLRYSPTHRWWTLFWIDHNGRWHRYPRQGPTPTVSVLLTEIDRDPTAVFWG